MGFKRPLVRIQSLGPREVLEPEGFWDFPFFIFSSVKICFSNTGRIDHQLSGYVLFSENIQISADINSHFDISTAGKNRFIIGGILYSQQI